MPGTFVQNDHPAGPKSHFFQPPRTPSASSSIYMTRSTTSNISTGSDKTATTGKKRSRQDYNPESNVTPQSLMGDWSMGIDTGDSMARSDLMDPGSPLPFVNTRYQIAGGLDTPGVVQAVLGEESEYSDVGYRKRLTGATQDQQPSYFPKTPVAQLIDANGRPRIPNTTPQLDAFGKALGVVGEVVSKVWDFCTAGAFRGFYAGGGNGYTINSDPGATPFLEIPSTEDSFWQDKSRQGLLFRDRESTPVPGTFPDDDFTSEIPSSSFNNRESTPPRAAKRRITGMDIKNDDIARNWVMVSGTRTSTTPAKTRTPVTTPRPAARYSMPTAASASRRPLGAAARPASRASAGTGLRRPAIANTRQPTVSHAGSPGLNSGHPASFASPRSPGGSKLSNTARVSTPTRSGSLVGTGAGAAPSPASIEAQQWAEKLRKEEAEADESMRRFNAQLKAMIREGKEALGTKVDVDVQDVDDDMGTVEGFEAVGKWR